MTITSTISRRGLRRAAIYLISLTAFAGAEAVAGAVWHRPAMTGTMLVGCAVSVFALYLVSRLLDDNADRAVLGQLEEGTATCEELAARLGLRRSVVRLSLTRLLGAGQLCESAPGTFGLLGR
ncbi:hypothetical protein ACIQOW_18610 [Kitasatospora sp. NPDC091335]|uniref:hypothetical protein n=1 Tax=Kitasatospora sp. NPDC091335 TaxID=3364085 RepID=UPI003818DB12